MFSVAFKGYFDQDFPPSVVEAKKPPSPAIQPRVDEVKKTATRSPLIFDGCNTQPGCALRLSPKTNETRQILIILKALLQKVRTRYAGMNRVFQTSPVAVFWPPAYAGGSDRFVRTASVRGR